MPLEIVPESSAGISSSDTNTRQTLPRADTATMPPLSLNQVGTQATRMVVLRAGATPIASEDMLGDGSDEEVQLIE